MQPFPRPSNINSEQRISYYNCCTVLLLRCTARWSHGMCCCCRLSNADRARSWKVDCENDMSTDEFFFVLPLYNSTWTEPSKSSFAEVARIYQMALQSCCFLTNKFLRSVACLPQLQHSHKHTQKKHCRTNKKKISATEGVTSRDTCS